jgi:hypothetical protein
MKKRNTVNVIAFVVALIVTTAQGQTQTTGQKTVAPAATSTPVTGSGTSGQLVKWTGSTTTTSVVGDSNIFEDKFGKVGIGTRTPTSLLTVAGMIETTLGGYKFPDGTVQTTALSASQVVSSLNGLKGDVTLAAGTNISITPSGNTLTIAATGVLTGVTHDDTLTGNGSAATPLGVAIPLILTGSVDTGNGVITTTNTAPGGPGIFTVGGTANAMVGGGTGLLALGGTGGTSPATTPGGVGMVGFGGSASNGNGGTGGSFIGGVATAGNGGDGTFLVGALGVGAGKKGGRGLVAIPGGGAGGAIAGLAGEFLGDVEITGNLAKGGGSFKIDHPLDPENKYLYHSFVESPDMMNIYNGTITTDQNGDAVVEMPDYFEALNRDFRYQLTVIGTFAQAIIAEKMRGNQFRIKTNAANVEVSWQVTGVRQDAYANKHRIPVEEAKSEKERGYYLHADAFNQPEERSVQFVQSPEIMLQIKEQRQQVKQKQKAKQQ